jgi:predicted  nucleic acid-binding Zn-ribbon protein
VALAEVATERAEATSSRESIAAALPAELLALYEKQRSRYGTGASLLRGGVSQASGVALTEDELQKIRVASPDDVLLCPSSDAILVRTGESGI